MKILVTGGGGFLGSTICRQLALAGHEVIAFQRSRAEHLEPHGVKSSQGDIRNAEAVSMAVEGCDAVIHCAAYAALWGDAEKFNAINVDGTRNVLNACRDASVKGVVYTSSPSVVLKGEDIEGGDESLPLVREPLMPYQASKIAADKMVTEANSSLLRTVVLRPHLMWGPGDPHFLRALSIGRKTTACSCQPRSQNLTSYSWKTVPGLMSRQCSSCAKVAVVRVTPISSPTMSRRSRGISFYAC